MTSPFVPAKAGTQNYRCKTGFPLEFTPAKAGAGMSGGSVLDNRDHGVRRRDMRCLTPDLIPEALTPMPDNLMPEP